MPKITESEIKDLWDFADCEQPSCEQKLKAALDRLAELEAAVAWHNWDELPKAESMIVLRTDDGRIGTCFYSDRQESGEEISDLIDYDGEPMALYNYEIHEKFIEWSYPVGDLS